MSGGVSLSYGVVGKWYDKDVYGTSFDDFTTTNEALMIAYVEGKAARQNPTHGGPVASFTDTIRDVVGAMVVQAGGTYNSGTGVITLPSGGDTESMQDVVGAMFVAAGGTYNDGAGTVAFPIFTVADGTITEAKLAFSVATQAELDAVAAAKANTSHVHSGADITSGTVPVAVIGTGTKNSTTFYRGDGTFAVPAGGGGATNLTVTLSPTSILVLSDTGTDATLPLADGTNAGLMAPAQFTKLGGVATGATANSADATLLNRTNHTGTQLANTISDLITAVQGVPLSTTTASGIGTATTQVEKYVTDGPIRGPFIWLPSSAWRDLMLGVADARFFGAKFDGTTDDTAAIQAAIDELGAIVVPNLFFQSSAGTFQGGVAAPGAGQVVLPYGTAMISQLVGKHRVHILGKGDGTLLRQIAATSGPMIRNRRDAYTTWRNAWNSGTAYAIGDAVTLNNEAWIAKTAHTNVSPVEGATWTKMVHASYVRLSDFQLDGNKANQSAANHGIQLLGDTQNNYNNPSEEDYDDVSRVWNVYIRNTKGTGLFMDGAGGNFISGIKTRNCDAYGIHSGQDNNIDLCDIGWSGLAGVFVKGDSCRLTNIKSWFGGQVTPASGPGFQIEADSGVMAACTAQDNKTNGFLFKDAHGWSAQGLEADDNDKLALDHAGFYFQNSKYCNMTGVARNRYNGANTAGAQDRAVKIDSSSLYNTIVVSAGRTAAGWGVSIALTSDSVKDATNSIKVNNVEVAAGATT